MERVITFTAPHSGKMRDVLRNRFSARFCTFLKKEEGRILHLGAPATGRTLVSAGDEVTVRFCEEIRPPKKAAALSGALALTVRYEDEDIIAVHKPRGVASLSTFGYEETNVISALYAQNPHYNYHVVTRLDKDTEGLVLVAKSGAVHSLLQALGTDLKKEYLAEAEGMFSRPVTVDAPIARGADVTRVISAAGQRAITQILPLHSAGGRTYLCALPITGRTHQIRLHLSYIGHPVCGDTLYGRGVGAYNSGQHLACYRLTFPHPVTGKTVQITDSLPSFWVGEKPF